jgi:hypothetical protein
MPKGVDSGSRVMFFNVVISSPRDVVQPIPTKIFDFCHIFCYDQKVTKIKRGGGCFVNAGLKVEMDENSWKLQSVLQDPL